MTESIIRSYVIESRAKREPRKLLVCGPTNKSVVVLARQLLRDLEASGDTDTNMALIGDKGELLIDNEEELERWFVYTTIKDYRKCWKRQLEHLLKNKDFIYFENRSNNLLAEMRRKLSSVRMLEEPLMTIKALFSEAHDSDTSSRDEEDEEIIGVPNLHEEGINDAFKDIDMRSKTWTNKL
jgi:hypothetical protein